jgi:hypothetical protein
MKDPDLLAWAFQVRRILVSYDLRTMPGHVGTRHLSGLSVAGVFLAHEWLRSRIVIEELLAFDDTSDTFEWFDQTLHLPYFKL